MKSMSLEMAVGLFMLAGLLCLVYLAVKLGDVPGFDRDIYPVKATFISTSGLKEGAVVELAGVRVGQVSKINLDVDEYQAEVWMNIDSAVRLQEDAIASIRTQGIIGDKFVKITPGGSDELIGPGEELLETESSISLEELISKYIFEQK